MIDFTKPVQTKKGFSVTIISTEARGNCPIIGYIGESKTLEKWYADGRYLADSLRGEFNLENAPEYWVKEKEAFEAGKTIQYRSKVQPHWEDMTKMKNMVLRWFNPDEDHNPEYRIKPESVPLTKDDVKAGNTFLNPTGGYEYQWAAKSAGSVMLGSFWRTYKELKEKGWKIKSLDSDWRPCEKEASGE